MKQKLHSMMYHLNSNMQRYMVGRYGGDELGRFISGAVLVFFVLSWITGGEIFRIGAWILVVCCYFRMFSKNISKRYGENQKFLTLRYKAVSKWSLTKKHFTESKTHRFFKCPKCKQKVRVPKGRGKICITCPKCRVEFVKKS